MRLSRHSDYAFRMLIHAALRRPGLTTVNEVANDFGLSAAHLHKVAQTLSSHGYLKTIRGRAGGLQLAQTPAGIRLGQVAAITEPDFRMAPCMPSGDVHCPIYAPCVLRTALSNAAQAFLAELDKWTLADLIHNQKPLLFALETAGARSPAEPRA